MAKTRAKSTKRVKEDKRSVPKVKEDGGRNFTIDEVKYIINFASQKTLSELAEHLDATEAEVKALIDQYNKPGQSFTKQSYLVGTGDRKGVVVATGASSQLGDKIMGGADNKLTVKPDNPDIFYQPTN